MSSRKIKDAKDLSTNELIYFKSHAKATYMSDGTTVEDVINNINVSGGTSVTIDSSMSSTSTNPVQNNVIKSYIDSNCNIPTETTTASSKSLTANKYCKWTNTPTSITITLATPSDTSIVNNYMFEFTASSSGCTLSVPSTIKWINGTAPSIEAGKTYQISIINNLATVAKFS